MARWHEVSRSASTSADEFTMTTVFGLQEACTSLCEIVDCAQSTVTDLRRQLTEAILPPSCARVHAAASWVEHLHDGSAAQQNALIRRRWALACLDSHMPAFAHHMLSPLFFVREPSLHEHASFLDASTEALSLLGVDHGHVETATDTIDAHELLLWKVQLIMRAACSA